MRIKIIVGTILSMIVFVLMVGSVILGLDLMLHRKFDQIAGLNYRGYRGKIIGKKKANEIRIAMFGGSPLWGYGVYYWEAVPFQLEKLLQSYSDSLKADRSISVINLGYNNEGIFAIYYNLQDFDYLQYDYVLICTGFDDLGVGNTTRFRQSNPIFKVFNYMPILSTYLQEKMMLLRSNGNLEDAYWGKNMQDSTVSRQNFHANALNNLLMIYNSSENVINRIQKVKTENFNMEKLKSDRWAWFKHYLRKSIDEALSKKKKVVIITEPRLNIECGLQQDMMGELCQESYFQNSNVTYMDIGRSFTYSPQLFLDGCHFSAQGCQVFADSIFQKLKKQITFKIEN